MILHPDSKNGAKSGQRKQLCFGTHYPRIPRNLGIFFFPMVSDRAHPSPSLPAFPPGDEYISAFCMVPGSWNWGSYFPLEVKSHNWLVTKYILKIPWPVSQLDRQEIGLCKLIHFMVRQCPGSVITTVYNNSENQMTSGAYSLCENFPEEDLWYF